ncbi:MAG: hypothetical protein ACUVWN_08110 [bacterium]
MITFFAEPCLSAFQDDFLGARSLAMGGAYTALADEADGALVNPAGLSMLRKQQLCLTSSALYLGLSDGSFISQNIMGYAFRQKKGSNGLAWKRFGVSNLYAENTVVLSHSMTGRLYFTKGDRNRPRNISLGINLKFLNWDSAPTMGPNGQIIEDIPGWSGFDLDFGIVVWPAENTPVAVSFQNIFQPNINSKLSKIKEDIPRTTRMGVAVITNNTIWALDLVLREGEIDFQTGLERQAQDDRLFIRTGFGLKNLAWGMNFMAGAGYRITDSIRFDYAFVYPVNTIVNTIGSHRVSVIYNFGN